MPCNEEREGQLLDVIYIYPTKAQLIQKALEKYSQGKRKVALSV